MRSSRRTGKGRTQSTRASPIAWLPATPAKSFARGSQTLSSETDNVPQSEVTLTGDHKAAIEDSENWTTSALAQLGQSYLEYADVETRYLKAKADLTKHRGAAVQAEMSRGNVLAAIVQELELSPGEWTYDPKQGKLRKRST